MIVYFDEDPHTWIRHLVSAVGFVPGKRSLLTETQFVRVSERQIVYKTLSGRPISADMS